MVFHGCLVNSPRLPDVISASSTERTVTITWSFTSVLETRNETFTVLYGTSPGQLGLTSPPVSSVPNVNRYSVQLTSLQPGTTYYYQIQSANKFRTLQQNITTMDSSKCLSCCRMWHLMSVFSQGSSSVVNIMVSSPESSILIINWLPPVTPNGMILNYMVKIILFSNGQIILEEKVNDTEYTGSSLS